MSITVLAKTHIADQLSPSSSELPMLNIAIGTGTPSATALGTELHRKGVFSKSHTDNVITIVGKWDLEDRISGSITEAGIFNLPVLGGTMFCSQSFVAISKGIYDNLTITWTITFQ